MMQFRPDYKKSVQDVYRDVAAWHIMDGCDSLDILAFCGSLFMEVKIDTGLVSWVPESSVQCLRA